ncbi:MAG: hypothetical protein ACREKH_06785 [Candidatus Rokuibacteriota bacterium]
MASTGRREVGEQGRMRHLPLALVVTGTSCLLGFSPAFAYVDAGTGSILLQAIIGAVAAGLAILVGLRERISARFARRKSTRRASPNASATPTTDVATPQANGRRPLRSRLLP